MARVFLCEDDDSFRLLTRLQLEQHGHVIVGESADGAGCATGVIDGRADVALIDGSLRDDAEWAELRAAAPDAKLVLYSGMPADRLAADAERLGADGWVAKSTGFAELAELVQRLAG